MSVILLPVAIGIVVPVVLLMGPYLPYLRPVRHRLPDPEANHFREGLMSGLGKRDADA